ncbi:hypothetical protein STENM327S_06702 [Streptomyces tendae]
MRLPALRPISISASRSRSEYAYSKSSRPHLILYSGGRDRYTCPDSTSGRMKRNRKVSSRVLMCWPSTSASAIRMIL